MNKNISVRDIQRRYTYIDKDELIPKAFWTLESSKDTHLVVVENKIPVGIISYKDFLRVLTNKARRGLITKLHVSSLMTINLVTVEPDTSIQDAAKLMIQKGISSVLVESGGKIVGIITKRDLLKHIEILPDVLLKTFMTKNPIAAPAGMSLTGAEKLLRDKKISTLPVVEEGNVIGYVDIRILAQFLLDVFLNQQHKHINKLIHEVTLGDIMKRPSYMLPDDKIHTFAKEILRRGFKGAPIVSSYSTRNLLGVATETDVTKLIASI
ncbi:MAG: CBS domain-containing protein [Candidatus Njordarchaeales archaeon]